MESVVRIYPVIISQFIELIVRKGLAAEELKFRCGGDDVFRVWREVGGVLGGVVQERRAKEEAEEGLADPAAEEGLAGGCPDGEGEDREYGGEGEEIIIK